MNWLKELFRLPREHVMIAFSMSLAGTFLLGGYEFIRSSSGSLFKAAYGANAMPYMLAVLPFAMVLAIWIYGRVLSSLGPRRTLFFTTLGSALLIVAGYLAIVSGSKIATAFVYLLREAYVMLILEQYWSFMNSRMSESSAKKLNGPITGVASLGPIACGLLVGHFAVRFGASSMLLGAALFTVVAAFVADRAYARVNTHYLDVTAQKHKHGHLALEIFREEKILIPLFGLIFCTQILSTFLTLHFESVTQIAMPNADQQTAYMGIFYSSLNGVALILQFIVAPVLLRFVRARWIHVAIPLIHLAACIWLILHPSLLSAAGLAYFLFKVIDYSVFRAVKEVLYIPLSFDARYRAKELIDVFAYRSGKGVTSLSIILFEQAGMVLRAFYGWISLGVLALWLATVWKLTKEVRPEV